MRSKGYRKLLSLKLFRNCLTFILNKILEKGFEVMEIIEAFNFEVK